MIYEVLIPPHVEAEIEAIGDYIAQDNPAAAQRMMARLSQRIQSLAEMPERGRPYGRVYRAVLEGPYSIFYRVESAQVIIVAVLHHARDIERLLGKD